eukprot:TRINITY_DN62365_c0_g1_i2.p1 TRINITY_DN62365_c0_g1~~TRINITY_DN62365_c0_g1_i2.p1  ORF type:complete len:415 (+),score=26.41 TRINITY_DN62365_c0_g1_i2:63-1307(+)
MADTSSVQPEALCGDMCAHIETERRSGLSRAGVFIAVFKANCGCGILFMPKAWSYGGDALSTILLFSTGAVAIFCSLRLLDCRIHHPKSTYGELMVLAVGPWGSTAVDVSVVAYQFGLCCTYLFTVGTLLRAALLPPKTPLYWLLIAEAIVFIPLVAIRRVSKLWAPNLLGSFLVISGIMTVLGCESTLMIQESIDWDSLQLFNWSKCLVFLGTAAFSFEGVGSLLLTYDDSEEPEQFRWIYTLAMSTVIVLSCALGLLGSIVYGEDVNSQVLLNLRHDSSRLFTQVAFGLAMMATFPLQLLPGVNICEESLFKNFSPGCSRKYGKNLFRGFIVVILSLIAFVGSHSVDHFVSIIGAFCGIPLNFIFPLICHQAFVGGRINWFVNMTIGLFGGILTVAITFLNITLWVQGDDSS